MFFIEEIGILNPLGIPHNFWPHERRRILILTFDVLPMQKTYEMKALQVTSLHSTMIS